MDIILAAIASVLGNLSSDTVKTGYSRLKEKEQQPKSEGLNITLQVESVASEADKAA